MRNKLHIVGLRYHGWCGRMAEIFASGAATCIGQKLFLLRDHSYEGDAHAVMAWSTTEAVGHVCRVDLPLIAGVLEQGKRKVVAVRIVALDTERRALVVEPVEDLPEVPYQDPELPSWTWNGPVLPLPMIWAQADHLGIMMDMLAAGEQEWDEEVVKRYLQYTVTDLSAEAYKNRLRLVDTLGRSTDPRFLRTRQVLLSVMDHMGSRERLQGWFSLMTNTVLNSPEAHSLASRYAEMEAHHTLESIRSFPLDIGREWLAGNGELFANRMYYGQIPRTDILKLFSLIILYESSCHKLKPIPVQPAIGVNLNGNCCMSVEQFTNSGTVISIEKDGNSSHP